MKRGEPGVDSLRAKLRAKQGDLQLSMAAADSVVKETIRWERGERRVGEVESKGTRVWVVEIISRNLA